MGKILDKVMGVNTRLVHSGGSPHEFHGFINPPVVRASTVLFPDATTMKTNNQRFTYGIHGTPTTEALCSALNELEKSEKTLLLPSGLAAVTIALLSALKAGDHLLITDSVYGPTRRFVNHVLRRMGIEPEYYYPTIGADIAKLVKKNTKVIYVESPGSNTFELQDIPSLVAVAKATGAIVMMDNTWATPLLFRPLDFGVDVSINAATKYHSGHSDVLFGYISAKGEVAGLIDQTYTDFGMSVSGDDAYLVLRGMRTMGLRLKHQQNAALEIARWLEHQPQVEKVIHPALPSHPQHEIWQRDFDGSSGLFSFLLKGESDKKVNIFLNELKIFGLGYSWGGFESLAVHVDLSDRRFAEPHYGALIRLQIGLEDVNDLKRDLLNALQAYACK